MTHNDACAIPSNIGGIAHAARAGAGGALGAPGYSFGTGSTPWSPRRSPPSSIGTTNFVDGDEPI